MKKVFFILLLFCATTVSAQEIQIQNTKKQNKIVVENSNATNNQMLYVYNEISVSNTISTYTQVIYENSFGRIALHGEYRSFIQAMNDWQNTYICGLSFNVIAHDNFYLNLAPLYRYEKNSMWQATATYGFSYRILSFDGYFDYYGDKIACAFSENKLKLHFNKLFIGINVEYSSFNTQDKVTPYIMFGIKM